MASYNHNKKRNTGLVYEFIIRKMASQLLDDDKNGYAKSLQLVKKYYSAGTPLAKERELFEAIRSTRGVSESIARKIMLEVKQCSSKLDKKKIEIKKSNLIKEINHSFGKEFYSSHRIPEYRLLASIQMLIDGCCMPMQINESVMKIQLEEALIEFMTTVTKPKQANFAGDKVDNLVATLAAKKFGERYGDSLNRDQKVLLERYVKSTMADDRVNLGKFMSAEKIRLIDMMSKAYSMKEMKEDKTMASKLIEARQKLFSLDTNCGSDLVVEEFMLFYKLAEELTSNE